ncbi:hypothetical protein [Lamprobacter modestohalophilus]|uniref:hypothetical protein n=1 Tax=Lamprobacter modestohalophilus TaxID=1064514 RepID=UPI0019073DA4|nr:hypothetical protein [Lamprobacter modestohalophilus]
MHDDGSAPASIRSTFNRLKAWERRSLDAIDPRSPVGFSAIVAALRAASEQVPNLSAWLGKPPMPLTWIAEFLYRPLYFAGVGLSDQESGLWWLLAQRARNHARVGEAANALVCILLGRDNRPAFWRTRAFGIEPVLCDDWDAGWARLLELSDRSDKRKC